MKKKKRISPELKRTAPRSHQELSYFSISLGIQQIFFFIQEKHEQQCLTNMYVYTFFFF